MKEYEKDYHHGNLRKELIEKGINVVSVMLLRIRTLGIRMNYLKQ